MDENSKNQRKKGLPKDAMSLEEMYMVEEVENERLPIAFAG